MVAYRLDGGQGTRTQTNNRPLPEAPRSIADYIAETRLTANEYQHPLAVFDLDGQPVFRNSALAARLTSEQHSQSSDRTWQTVYATACRIVTESISGRTSLSTVVPVDHRSFAILGSLLRQASGTIYGATAHIAEVTGVESEHLPPGSDTKSSGLRRSDEEDDAYRSWIQRREESRSQMQRLSPRETEVVSRVSAGLPNKSIARELEISVKTIEKHRANAVRKLGVTSTPEMVRIAVLADHEVESTASASVRALEESTSTIVPPPRFTAGMQRAIID